MSSVTGRACLFENFTVIAMTESALDWREACMTTLRVLSVTMISFEVGRPLFSGRADENAHSSSSFEAAGAWAGCGLAKSNMDAGTVPGAC